jgi:hypothetical protein
MIPSSEKGVRFDRCKSFSHFKTEKSLSTVAVLGKGEAHKTPSTQEFGPCFVEVCLLTVTSQGSLEPWLLDDDIQKLLVRRICQTKTN